MCEMISARYHVCKSKKHMPIAIFPSDVTFTNTSTFPHVLLKLDALGMIYLSETLSTPSIMYPSIDLCQANIQSLS